MVYVDTNILVYLLEGTPRYAQSVARELASFRQRGLKFYGSTLLVSEFTAGTSGTIGDLRMVGELSFIPVSEPIATLSGLLQRKHTIKIGDSIHLATAIEMGYKTFFTNDKKLAAVASKYLSAKLLSDHLDVS